MPQKLWDYRSGTYRYIWSTIDTISSHSGMFKRVCSREVESLICKVHLDHYGSHVHTYRFVVWRQERKKRALHTVQQVCLGDNG
jgi:hypothetical protein